MSELSGGTTVLDSPPETERPGKTSHSVSIVRWIGAGWKWLALIAVFLLSSEVFMRLDDTITWGAPFVGVYNNDRLLLQDSFGFRGRPGYRYQKWRMNNAGFRGADLPETPADGSTRVVIAGASETFGLYEKEGVEFPARMQAILDSVAPAQFEIINAALPGMSLSSMDSYFQHAILPLKPRLLMIYVSPTFYLAVRPLARDYSPPRFNPAPVRQFGAWQIEPGFFDSRLVEKSRDVLKELVPRFAVTTVRQFRLDRTRAEFGADWLWPSVPADRMELMRVHLERLVKSVQASGVTVALVTHTNRFDGAASDTLAPARRHLVNILSLYYPRATPEVLVNVDSVANEVIRQVASAHGALIVEAERKIPPTDKYFADYTHFTDAGADSVARILAAEVVRLGPDLKSEQARPVSGRQ